MSTMDFNTTTTPSPSSSSAIPCTWPSSSEDYVFQHVLFQLANLFLFISLVAPPGLWGLFYLRLCLFLGFLFFLVWGAVVMCLLDVVLWNTGNTLLNLIQVVILVNKLLPVKIKPEMLPLYDKVFKLASISKRQFRSTYSLKTCKLVHVKSGHVYAHPGKTKCDRISVLLSGSMEVSCGDRILHSTVPYSFIDSPEYMAFTPDDVFQVQIKSTCDCTYLSWERPDLSSLFAKDSVLGSTFEHVIGRDVALKLFKNNLHQMANVRGSRQDLVKLGYLERTEIQDLGVVTANDVGDKKRVPLAEVTEMIDDDYGEDEGEGVGLLAHVTIDGEKKRNNGAETKVEETDM